MNSPTSYPPAVVPPPAHPTLAPNQVPERRGALAVLSHTRRDADWILPRLFRVFAFWGNVELDLTHVLLGAGTSEIEIRCIMASVEIIVPPDLRVESEVDAILGSAEVRRQIASTTRALRSRRPRHAWKLHAREPTDLVAARTGVAEGRWEKAMSDKATCTAGKYILLRFWNTRLYMANPYVKT